MRTTRAREAAVINHVPPTSSDEASHQPVSLTVVLLLYSLLHTDVTSVEYETVGFDAVHNITIYLSLGSRNGGMPRRSVLSMKKTQGVCKSGISPWYGNREGHCGLLVMTGTSDTRNSKPCSYTNDTRQHQGPKPKVCPKFWFI